MKIAVTDACIFLDLFKLMLLETFLRIDPEIHTSRDVVEDLPDNQKTQLLGLASSGKLFIHNISEQDRIRLLKTPFPKTLSQVDKAMLFLAMRLNALVISSDMMVRKHAIGDSIEYHGILWIFDQLVKADLLTMPEACSKLEGLVIGNLVYQNNLELVSEMNKRLRMWRK